MPLSAGARQTLAPWLRLVLTPGIGPAAMRRLLESFGLPEDVLAAGFAKLSAALDPARARALLAAEPGREAAIEATLDWAEHPGRHLLTLEDARYPPRLLEIADPPPLLFVLGDPGVLARPSLAVVGSRNATQSGLGHAHDFARSLAQTGLTIVSGLAQGIDAAAHRGALETSAGTVAVVGTGVDLVYPTGHEALAEAIAARGAIVSELPLGTAAVRSNFPRRNRLIAGLSLATLVVEAARQSGSLITARQAAEAGREVMAIPGSIHSPLSKGCHRLIREGAKLVESAEDVLVELRAQFRPARSADDAGKTRGDARDAPALHAAAETAESSGVPEASAALVRAMGFDPVDVDTLIDRTGRPAGELAALLLRLELEGKIERLVDGRFARL